MNNMNSVKFVVSVSCTMFFSLIHASEVVKEGIRETVRENIKSVRECYEKRPKESLKESPKADGKIVFTWVINDKGEVIKVEVDRQKTTLRMKSIQDCLAKEIKSWSFPAAPVGEERSVSYPFVFSVEKPDGQ
ncbi:MAG: AgmX/PglI C-terminal domain-containing protein [Bdellovibrionales bacterium]